MSRRHRWRASDEFEGFLALAEFPNTSTVWSGFCQNSSQAHPHNDADEHLRRSLEAFGADRIMWCGDWNRPGYTPRDYSNAMNHILGLPFLDADQKQQILRDTATRVFSMPEAI